MATADEEYRRKRANLELIGDEFRRSNGQYPPLHHELLFSRHKVSCRAWRALTASRPHHTEWEYWHGPEDGSWFGRFFGSNEGLNEFKRLCESLSTIFPEIRLNTAVTDWMGIVHEIAEKHTSPLLGVVFQIWGDSKGSEWDPNSDNSWDKFFGWLEVGVDPCEKFSEDMQINYPASPAQRTLKYNVFTSSVAAIQIIMDPHLVVCEGGNYDDLPLILLPPESKQPTQSPEETVNIEDAIFLTAEGTLPDFLFKQAPNGWLLRFVQGDKVEQHPFPDLKGLRHYHKLLMSPHQTITCLELDPRPDAPKVKGSTVTTDQYLGQFDDKEDFTGFLEEGGSHQGWINDEEIQELKEHALSLTSEIKALDAEIKELSTKTGDESKDAANAKLRQKREELRKTLKADFNKTMGLIRKKKTNLGKGTEAEKAFNRVKKAMKEAIAAIHASQMYLLYHYLQDYICKDKWGYSYVPQTKLPWEL